jgi:hypothetical protein
MARGGRQGHDRSDERGGALTSTGTRSARQCLAASPTNPTCYGSRKSQRLHLASPDFVAGAPEAELALTSGIYEGVSI